jgi:ABC-type transporter MlaC component
MKFKKTRTFLGAALCRVLAVIFALAISSQAAYEFAQQIHESKSIVSPQEKRTLAAFDKRVKQYIKLRDQVKSKVPKISKDSTPEQIAAHEQAFAEGLRARRAGAKPGDLLTRDIADYIRARVKREFQGTDRKEIRKILLDDETKPIALRVNYPYPDANAFTEMPATLLLKLPPLPKQVKYRYVGRNLFLVDSDNNLIIDYMPDALP